MSDNQRHRREEAKPRYYAVDSAVSVEIGDMCWLNTDDIRPASSFSWSVDLATTQRAFALLFQGMSAGRSKIGETADIGVDWSGVKEFTCASTTWEIGDMIAPAKASGNALENQKVAKVTDPTLAIGVVTKRYAANTTTVQVEIYGILGLRSTGTYNTPAEIVAAIQTTSGSGRLDTDYTKDGSTNHVFTAADDTKLTAILASKLYAAASTADGTDASANLKDIDTGFGAAPTMWHVQILRSGVDVKADAVVTALTAGDAGKIRVADSAATYNMASGDVIHLLAIKV